MFMVCKLENFRDKYSCFYTGDVYYPEWYDLFEEAAGILELDLFEMETTTPIDFRVDIPEEMMNKTICLHLYGELADRWRLDLEHVCGGTLILEKHGIMFSDEPPEADFS